VLRRRLAEELIAAVAARAAIELAEAEAEWATH
jgi:hypothetical protein